MKSMLKFWPLAVFILLSIKIFSDQPTLFSGQSYKEWVSDPLNYAYWPATQFQDANAVTEAEHEGDIVMFRGNPQRQGWTEGQLAADYKVAWRFPYFNEYIHGAAKSSPVADEFGIYIGSDMGWFYALDWDGKVKWRIYNEAALKGVHGTAVIDGDLLFYGDYAGRLNAVNKRTGELLWTRSLGETLGASPLLLGDFLYANVELIPANGYIAKINKRDGSLVFKSHWIGEQSHSSPAFDVGHNHIIFGTNSDVLFSLHIDTGNIDWSYKSKGKIKSTPLIYQNRAYYTNWGSEFAANDLDSGMPVFSSPLKDTSMNSPALLHNGIVVADKTHLYRFSFDGVQLSEMDLKNTRNTGSPLVVRHGNREDILVTCEDTDLCLVTADFKSKKKIFTGDQPLSSIPFVYKDYIVFAQDKGDLIVLKKSR